MAEEKLTIEGYDKWLTEKLKKPKAPVANNVLQRLMQKAREKRLRR